MTEYVEEVFTPDNCFLFIKLDLNRIKVLKVNICFLFHYKDENFPYRSEAYSSTSHDNTIVYHELIGLVE